MTALNKQSLTDEAISQAFTGTNFGRDDLRNILAETVIDAAAGWRSGHTATTICIQLGLLTVTRRASALGLRFISEHVCRETKRLKDELEAAQKLATRQGNIAAALLDEVATLRRNADDKAPEFRAQLIEADNELDTLRQRVAELEARTITVKFEPIPMEELGNRRDGKKHPYMFGAGYNSAVVHCESVLHHACAAAGIGVKGE